MVFRTKKKILVSSAIEARYSHEPETRFKHLTFEVTMAQTTALTDGFIEILTQQARHLGLGVFLC